MLRNDVGFYLHTRGDLLCLWKMCFAFLIKWFGCVSWTLFIWPVITAVFCNSLNQAGYYCFQITPSTTSRSRILLFSLRGFHKRSNLLPSFLLRPAQHSSEITFTERISDLHRAFYTGYPSAFSPIHRLWSGAAVMNVHICSCRKVKSDVLPEGTSAGVWRRRGRVINLQQAFIYSQLNCWDENRMFLWRKQLFT